MIGTHADERNYDPLKVITKLKQDLTNLDKFCNILPEGFHTTKNVNLIEVICINGNFISVNNIIMLPLENFPLFHEIIHIIIFDEKIFVITKKFKNVYYDMNVNAFEVMSDEQQWTLVNVEYLYNCIVTHKITTNDGKQYIIKNWFQ